MKKLAIYFLGFVFMAAMSSCIKDHFDAPPAGGTDPDLKVNFCIDSVKHRYSGSPYRFTEDLIISAVVVGDDKGGNLYKQLAIVDSTGGIILMVGSSYLYNNYPVGRRLFIKLKGLYIVNYHGIYQICSYINPDGSFGGIPSSLVTQYVVPGKWGLPVVPKVVTISQLNASYQSQLIEIENVEFVSGDMNQPYADAYNQQSIARTIKDCNGRTIELYTSGYANFAKALTPTGNGRFIAIYSLYNSDAQLLVRDTTDIMLDGIPCNGVIPPPTGGGIAAVRALYHGSPVVLGNGTAVTGIVISDKSTSNMSARNLIIQDSTGGILVRFTGNHSFVLGDKVTVNLSGDSLNPFRGWLQVTNVPLSNATKTGTGTITPRTATVAQINSNASAWESTLIKISNATITGGGGQYSGNTTINDGTASATMYTAPAATFASSTYPTGARTITAILTQFNGVQMQIRNTNDVQ